MTADLKRVFIVGGAGRIGTTVRKGLAERYDFSGIDAKASDDLEITEGDARDLATLEAAFEGQDAVIYLPNMNLEPGTWEQGYENDLPAILEHIRSRPSQRRQARDLRQLQPRDGEVRARLPVRPDHARRARRPRPGEHPLHHTLDAGAPAGTLRRRQSLRRSAGRWFSDQFGMSVICLRVGRFTGSDKPADVRQCAVLITPRDMAHLADRCLSAPDDVRFAIFYAVSNNKWRIWDISEAQRLIGYEPRDNMEIYRSDFAAP